MTASPSEQRKRTEGFHPLLEAVRPLADAIGATLLDAEGNVVTGNGSATSRQVPLRYEGQDLGAVQLPALDMALVHLLNDIAETMGQPLDRLGREDKQQVVKMLDERGAFALRKSVEDVADTLGVSRFTVYNYLARPASGVETHPGSGTDE